MTDSRPRPQYGEYATPEEQAKALGIPAHELPVQADPVKAHHAAPVMLPAGEAPHAQSTKNVSRPQTVIGSRDSLFTFALLGVGLAWVLWSIPSSVNFADTLNRSYALQGYTGHYGPVALASAIGLIISISSITLWAITCGVSIAVLRRHRRAFYIPLVGAVVTAIVVLALTLIAMLNDPGLLTYLSSMQK